MSEMDYLNYRPDFKRDEKEKTGWLSDNKTVHISESESGEVHQGKELDISIELEKYDEFKENFKVRVEELEKSLENIEIPLDETTERALNESGHKSTFTPKSYRELFEKKESSVGEYLIGVLEKQIENEYGSIDWEIFTEYLEIEEEISILDFYIKKILYPIISKDGSGLTLDEIKELEKQWIERTINNIKKFNIGQVTYEIAMTTSPKKIARTRDELHDLEKDRMLSIQEINQVESSLMAVNQKRIGLQLLLKRIDEILDIKTSEKLVKDLVELSRDQVEEVESIGNTVILVKQSIDQDNNQKKELKETRRNLYSKNKQKRIIDEYSSINHLFRENSLPSVHYMKSFQDNASEELNRAFDQSAKSIDRNYRENKEKAYETFLLQISTSQTRMNRLKCIESKQESRLMFQELINKYKETN